MGIGIEKLTIWSMLNHDINTVYLFDFIYNNLITQFIDQDIFRSSGEIKYVDIDEMPEKARDDDYYYDLHGYYFNNIIYIFYKSEGNVIKNRIAVSISKKGTEDLSILCTRFRELLFKIYQATKPVFIRSAHKSGAGDPIEEERTLKKIYSLHWMQIFSKEMLGSINVEKLKKSDKFYKVEELDDGAMFIQITEEPGYTYKLIEELSNEIELECPDEYKWWKPEI